MMHGHEKSDPVVVAAKRANKAERSAAEPVERRAGAEGNACQNRAHRAQNRHSASQALARIRQATKSVSPSRTRGGSRMRASRTYGSVRGALSNERPYRDP
jgi:RNA-directed DNA polymerase